MDYLCEVSRSIEFIEKNLKNQFDVKDVAAEVGFSFYHFHRIFLATTGYTVSDYIQKRRLTEASRELTDTDRSILEIALDYQFNFAETFSRSFARQFKTTPSKYRKNGKHCHLFETQPLKITENTNLKEEFSLTPQITHIDTFTVAGTMHFPHTSEVSTEISMHFKEFRQVMQNKIHGIIDPGTTYGILVPDLTAGKDERIQYLTCVQIQPSVKQGFGIYTYQVPAHLYAIFTHRRPISALVETYRYIYGNWLPRSKYIVAEELPLIEVYDDRFKVNRSELDIYIPIIE